MSEIAGKISCLKKNIPPSVKLVAVSKTMPVTAILDAYNAGLRSFGENRVQELLSKKDLLPPDIEWHLIGHLQSNKVKYIVPFIGMIQSVDSYQLLVTINSEALKINRIVNCLLQIRLASEATKFGFRMEELTEMADQKVFSNLKNVRICGVMGMASFTSDTIQIRREFAYLLSCFNSIKNIYFVICPHFKEISMGMSGDYEIAVDEGSTIVRIGSLIFGKRNK